jgi:uncharacterized protein YjdB
MKYLFNLFLFFWLFPIGVNSQNFIKDKTFDGIIKNSYSAIVQDAGWSSYTAYPTFGFNSSIITESNGNKYYQCNTTTATDDYHRALTQFTSQKVTTGKYKLTFKARATGAGSFYLKLSTTATNINTWLPSNMTEATPGITLSAATGGNYIIITPTDTWQTYSCAFDMAPTVDDYLRFFITFDKMGTFEIDDVYLSLYGNIAVDSLSITSSPSGLTTITIPKGSIQLLPVVLPSTATNGKVKWTTSDSKIATITDAGLVTALQDGTVTVSATTLDGSNLTATYSITITGNSLVNKITVTGQNNQKTINTVGGTLQMLAVTLPDDAPDKRVSWSVDKSECASIDSNGLLTAKANGTVVITATALDLSATVGTETISITGNGEPIYRPKPIFYLRGLLDMWKKSSANTTANRISRYNALVPASIRGNVVYSLGVNSAWYYTQIPSDYTAFIDDNYLDLCKRVDATGIKFVVNVAEIGNYPNVMPATTATFIQNVGSYYLTPAQVDTIFANTTNCEGIESGENFWSYNPTTVNSLLDMLRVCKKYNKKYIVGEGGWGYSSFVRFFNENYNALKTEGLGNYLIPVFKNTKPYGALVSQGSVFGAWVSGLTSGFGTWNDEWVWTYSSFKQSNEFPTYNKADNNYTLIPYTHYLKSWLQTIALGGSTSFMESMTFNRDATPLANMSPYLVPFIKGLAEHNIMPSREAVLAKVKIMANPYGLHTLSDGTTASYNPTNLISYQTTVVPYKATAISTFAEPYGRLFKNTYGFWNDPAYINTGNLTDIYYNYSSKNTGKNYLPEIVMRELLPNNPRYLTIPLLPHPSDATSVPVGIETVALNSLISDDALKTKFESLYPSTPNDNSAWAVEIDNSFFVINSNENADIDQNFTFNLGSGAIEKIDGTMPFQNILFGKREGVDNYWFQSNGYDVKNGISGGQKYTCFIKPTVLTIKCKVEPILQVEDNKSANVTKTWDPSTNILQLTINHTLGAVNFRLTASTLAVNIPKVPNFSVYPNPTKDLFAIKCETEVDYQVIDLRGCLITSGKVLNNLEQIDTHNWAKGMYLVKISNGNEQSTFKLIKN